MKNKKHLFLTLPVLVSAVSLSALTHASATLYKAKTDWTLHSEAAGGYCSASQGMTNKTYVTFAQRVDGSMSLAVDFQKKTFEAGKKYNFKIKSGGVSRTFNVTPTSENAIVFPLGSDLALLQELSKTAILNMAVGGDEYDFSLKQASGLRDKLSNCVTSIMPAQQTVTETVVSAPATVSSNTGSNEIAQLKAENTRLSNLLKDVRRQADAKLSSMTVDPFAEEAKERVFVLEKENSELKTKLESLSRLQTNLESFSSLEEKLEKAEQEKNALQKQLAEANTKILTVESDNAEISEKANTLDSLRLDLEEKETKILNMEQELATAQKTAMDLKAAQELSRKEIDRLNQVTSTSESGTKEIQGRYDALVLELEEKLADKQIEIDALNVDNQALTKEKTVLMSSLEENETNLGNDAELKGMIETLEARIVEKQTEIDALKAENETILAEVSEKTSVPTIPEVSETEVKLQEDIKNKDIIIAALENEKEALKAQLSEQKVSEKQLALQTEDNKLVERRYKSALVDLEAIKAENIDLEDQIDILERQIVDLKTDQTKVALTPDAGWDLEKATQRYQEAQREIVSLGRLVEQKDAQCNLEKKDIENLLFDPEIAEREQRIKLTELEEEIAQKDELIAQLRTESGSIRVPDATPVSSKTASATTTSQKVAPKPIVEKIELPEQVATIEPAVQADPEVEQATVEKANLTPYVRELLQTVSVSGDIQEQSKNGMKILRWKKEGLHGTAIEKPLVGQSLSSAVNAYIDRAQSKCSGDFAAVPSLQDQGKQTYEIACVKPDGKGSSASLLFLKKHDNMITIAHEGRTDLMEQAIDVRDEISKVAQN